MPKIPRYLITTAEERTWKFDRPVLFLGEWCRVYDRKSIWQDMDAIVVAPYGLGQEQKDRDHAKARSMEESLLRILSNVLNKHHGVQHSTRFWQIILGHWLRRYVDVIFNRINTLELCLREHQLSGVSAFEDGRYTLATLDSLAAIRAFNDDRWNNALYVRILNLLSQENLPLEVSSSDELEGFLEHASNAKAPLKQQLLRWIRQKIERVSVCITRESDAFIVNSYLPRKQEIKLQLALGQVPHLWVSPKHVVSHVPDCVLRNKLSALIDKNTHDTNFNIVCSLVFELLPVCYLEGFVALSEKSSLMDWPQNPKFIFTSNNFDTDEIFKCWAATKIESGSQYIVGQHGNNYGTYRYMHPSVEEATADKFLTWGWKDDLPQHVPAFILKMAGKKIESYDRNGGLLLIEVHSGFRFKTWDVTSEFSMYFDDQSAFIRKLHRQIKEHLTVRLHHDYKNLSWCEESRWRDIDPTIRLDKGAGSVSSLIGQSRLVIHSYDSTGLLETLSQDIPTLAFWQNELEHLRDSAKPYFEILVDAGIVHFSAESVATKVNEIWDDVEGWWGQSSVQEARKKFCDQYARVSQRPIIELRKMLLGQHL